MKNKFKVVYLSEKKLEVEKSQKEFKLAIKAKNDEIYGYFYYAIFYNEVHAFRGLLNGGYNVNVRSHEARMTPLMAAAEMGCFESVKLLVENDANIFSIDILGETARTKAWKNQYIKIAQYLEEVEHAKKMEDTRMLVQSVVKGR